MLGYMSRIYYLYYVINDKSMKTLLERMKPGYVNHLNNRYSEYPHRIGEILEVLKSTSHWTSLPYGIVSELSAEFNGDYSPSFLSTIFENN